MAKNNAKIKDVSSIISAGINPKTGLPIKASDAISIISKSDIFAQISIIDEQDAINSGTWFNLPEGLTGRLVERILYHKGQAIFFKIKDRFYFLPYTLSGTIDVYGRFTKVTPLSFNGTTESSKSSNKKEVPWIQGLDFIPRYEVQMPEDFVDLSAAELDKYISESCVILKDYTEGISQTIIPRAIINKPIIDLESECFPFMRTALLNSTGIQGIRVNNQDEVANTEAASAMINEAALSGRKYAPMVGFAEFQELTGGTVNKAEEFLLSMQSIDNYRLSLHGLDSGGIFQKRSHMLESEQQMNAGNIGLVMRDRVQNRQDFCNIVNSIFGIGMWYEPSEVVTNIDVNGDYIEGSNEDMNSNNGGSQINEYIDGE